MKTMALWWMGLVVVAFGSGCGGRDRVEGEKLARISAALTAPITHDFEDGGLNGWIARGPVTLTNTTEAAAAGTHSLKTTGRQQAFNGPSLDLLSQLTKGSLYRVTASVRLVAGEAPTTIRVTMQRTPTGAANQFDPIASNTSVTDAAWVTLTGIYSFTTDVTGLLLYIEASSPTASYYVDNFSLTEVGPPPLQADFEDGTPMGWIPRGGGVVVENTTEAAFAGTRSLKTTGRTQGFHGPSLPLTGQVVRGATYQVSVSARLVAGQAPTTVRVTMQRTLPNGTNAFDTIAQSANNGVTDAAWVSFNVPYSFTAETTALLLYVEATAATAAYYIDSFRIGQVAPPPGPPANMLGAAAAFETGTTEGWRSRTGGEAVAVSTADSHSGTRSLLTTNRTQTFQGPAFDVSNVMFNGSRYRVSLWAKLAPGQASTQLRVSLERQLGTLQPGFFTVVSNTTVTSDAWVQLAANFDGTPANTTLTLYVESTSATAAFYIDDVQITFIAPAVAERDIPSVYQTLAQLFPVGAAVFQGDLAGEHAFLLTRHFNSITSENDMKWSELQPNEGSFDYLDADAQVAFARANNMAVRGHTLVWHQQTPAWVFNDAAGVPLTPTPENRALLLQRMETHIRTVVTHFAADVHEWDVVNEVIDPAQPDGFRRSPWFDVIGPEYIDRAFHLAREVAPTAKLYINDFDTTNPTKRAFLRDLIVALKGRGVPVDGIGHQMHNNVDFPSGQAIVDTINLFDGLVEQAVTELDVSIYTGTFQNPILDYTEIPAERFVRQGYRYRDFFAAFKQLQGKIKSLTFWGKADDHTWLTSAARVNAPLLFDRSLTKKLAYWGVVDPLQLPGADLSAQISAQSAPVAAGQPVAFTITVTNNTDVDSQPFQPTDDDLPAANVVLSSPIPARTVFQSLAAPDGWACTTPEIGGTGQVRCTAVSLAAGASAAFILTTAPIDCATPDAAQITASANVTSTTADPNLAPNNTATASLTVANTAPIITLAGAPELTLECRTPFVDPGATAADACDGPVATAASGTVDADQVGTYAITYAATDSAGQAAAPVTRTVHVADTTPPMLSLLGANPIALECGATFSDPGAAASDSCAADVVVTTTGGVVTTVPGSYELGYLASDPSGNTAAATRVVLVQDTTGPAIDLIDLTVLLPGVKIVFDGQTVTVNGQTQPLAGGTVTIFGQTITLQGTTITINGRAFSVDGRTVVLLLPLHQYQTFTTADLVSAASDACDADVEAGDAVITQASSDEPENAPGSRDGNTTNDIVIGAGCQSVRLRVERDSGGNGRVYAVTLRVRDAAGNPSLRAAKVIVPAPQGLGSAVDDGPRYTATGTCP